MTFEEFNLHESLVEGLTAMNFTNPTPIQEQAIPIILDNQDLIACAQTGTGKTAAFLLPLIHKIAAQDAGDTINSLIISPTRELALQIDQALSGFSYFTPVSSIAIYGGGDGNSFDREKKALTQGANIIIATPGKIISHLNLGYVKVEQLQHLVLDEADRMLDMGFLDDIMKIISFLPEARQTLLFSATMPRKIRELAEKILIEPKEVNIAISKPAEKIFQAAFSVYDSQKLGLIKHLLSAKQLNSVIVFCSTKINTKAIEKELINLEFSAKAIHSDLEQPQREAVMREFKNKEINILVATDIVSRGIDVDGIDLVVNYDVPQDAEDYVHRIGRTARASASGVAFTFINEKEQKRFDRIEQLIEMEIRKPKVPAYLGEAPTYAPNARKGGRSTKRTHKKKGGNKPRNRKKQS